MAHSLALQLACDIRSLVDHPAVSLQDLVRWQNEAEVLREKLSSYYEVLADQLPEELEHYFSDSDIRLRDRGYDERQTGIVRSIIDDLEAGRYSPDPSVARLRRRADSGFH
jgi:hypothetical protein